MAASVLKKQSPLTKHFRFRASSGRTEVERGVLRTPRSFINTVPHMSFVWGEDNVNFLRARYAALQQSSLFRGMRYSEDHAQIKEWAPLVMEGRDPQQKVAATRTEIGTDVNYGEITRQLIASLQKKSNFSLQLSSEVRALKRNDDNTDRHCCRSENGTAQNIRAKFVFIGAGGAALKLLQESGIPEAKDYAGFPVGGQFLVSENPDVVNHHLAKVYGKASVGAPPMSVPHIDTRVLDGKRVVLFGPFATFSTKFLKNGSLWDLMSSTTTSNVMPMMHVGLDNFDLVKYLVSQVMLSEEDRFEALKEYYPQAKKRTGVCGKRGSACRLSSVMPRKVAYCVWVPKWSATNKEPLPRCWGHRQGVNRRADYVGSAGKSIWRSRFQPAMAGYVESDRSVLWTQAER